MLQKSFLLLGTGLIAGALLGGYGASLVYGDDEPACPPAPVPKICPPCPPPPICKDGAVLEEADVPTDPRSLPEVDPTESPSGLPGLPATAVQLANHGLRRELAECTKNLGGQSGIVLLDLVVTATSGVGHIRTAQIAKSEREIPGLHECLIEATKRVQFDWTQDDGETRLKYPVRIGP